MPSHTTPQANLKPQTEHNTAESLSSGAGGLAPGAGELVPLTPGTVVSVLLPMRLGQVYDYRIPFSEDQQGEEGAVNRSVYEGSFVRVPLGPRHVTGVVWGLGTDQVDRNRLKDILGVHDAPPLHPAFRAFIQWVAAYTMTDVGRVMKMAMSVPEALDPLKPKVGYLLGDGVARRMTVERQKVLDVVAQVDAPLSASELAEQAGVSTAVVRGLVSSDALRQVLVSAAEEGCKPHRVSQSDALEAPELSADQAHAAHVLRKRVLDAQFKPVLLDGVTGSGKTEVYFEAIEQALLLQKQVLVLLPEIALTSQWLTRFRDRFGLEPAVWHSDMSISQRRRIWRQVASGTCSVVVGARSALFLPMMSLGLIIVDEEHDSSFKQEEGVLYNGRDMAVLRAREERVPVVLASATPSLETYINAEAGRYERLELPSRHGAAQLPSVNIVNLVATPPERGTWLAGPTISAVETALMQGEQAMLFLNRRGYAPLTLCRTCGHRFACQNCSTWLVMHRAHQKLMCHHCGYQQPMPEVCPECENEETLAACGPGVERIAEEVSHRFPDARVAVLTSDSAARLEEVQRVVDQMEAQEIDILIGTQIVAKGYHFPNLTTVGVVDADLGLAGGDLRAAERTYQLLHQVAGRAGRADIPGHVYLQTYQPQHPVMEALRVGQRSDFYDAETEARQSAIMPPFARLAGVIVSGEDEQEVHQVAHGLAAVAPKGTGIVMYGPAPAPLSLLRGKTRWRLLLKTRRDLKIQEIIARWLSDFYKMQKKSSKVRIAVDIDPYSFL